MKPLNRILGHIDGSSSYKVKANSHSIVFGLYRISRSTLNRKLKEGKGNIICCGCHYKWEYTERGIRENNFGYRISPSTYKKIVKWSKSK